MCGDNAVRTLARMRGLSAADVGPFQAQTPVKPVLLDVFSPERCS
jgi:hypothetical protein